MHLAAQPVSLQQQSRPAVLLERAAGAGDERPVTRVQSWLVTRRGFGP